MAMHRLETLCFYTMTGNSLFRLIGMRATAVDIFGSVLIFGTVVGVTLAWGNVFCGWICPEGAIQEVVHVKRLRRVIPSRFAPVLMRARLGIFVITVVSCILTGSSFYKHIFDLGHGTGMKVFLSVYVLVAVFFSRLFCRALCPLGFVLGLASRFGYAGAHFSEHCIGCGKAAKACPTGALTCPTTAAGTDGTLNKSMCIACGQCERTCPKSAITPKGTALPVPAPAKVG
jgi:polyferredoxin